MKEFDYWLIKWILVDGQIIHSPTCFDVGTDPTPYCEEVLKLCRTDEYQKDRGGRGCVYDAYEVHRLLLA